MRQEGLASGTYGNTICHGGPDDDKEIVDTFTVSWLEKMAQKLEAESTVGSVIDINAIPDSL